MGGLMGGLVVFYFFCFINSDGHLDRLGKLPICSDLPFKAVEKTSL
jgi:hypothetical protein